MILLIECIFGYFYFHLSSCVLIIKGFIRYCIEPKVLFKIVAIVV